jgi:branched-chain amino acid transport system substrate-binding protein
MFNRRMGNIFGLSLLIAVMVMAGSLPLSMATAAEPIKVGQVSALSGQSAKSGEAIMRGLTLAIEEINAKGGVLGGRKFTLISRDDESNPPKGQMAARELIFKEKVTAFFGGLDSPVSLAIVPVANKEKVPFMGVWAAATPITRNGADPNYVFRVSAMDAIVDQALIQYAIKTYGTKKPGLMLINNPWGESNEKGLRAAIKDAKITLAGIEKLESRDVDVVPQLMRLKKAGADTIILVANVRPSATVVKSLARMKWDAPVVSHWGVSGGRFPELAGPGSQKVHFVQTYSFFGDQNEIGKQFIAAAKKKYSDINGPEDIFPPVGYANAYDAMHLLARGIEQAGSTNGDKIRMALENLKPHQGLIKNYTKAFTPENHDALGYQDYVMVRYVGNEIKPVGK